MAQTTIAIREKEVVREVDIELTDEERKAMGELKRVPFGAEMRKQFFFDDSYRNMNHGSFGAHPLPVHRLLQHHQNHAYSLPDPFLRYTFAPLLDSNRHAAASLLNAPPSTVVFVPNATTAVNTVLRALQYSPGDVAVYFDTAYGACAKTISYLCATTPLSARCLPSPHPAPAGAAASAFEACVRAEHAAGNRVRFALFDTVSSMPGVRVPFEALTAKCRELGVLSVVDGAHGAGHLPLDLARLDPDFFTTNLHKWLFVPRPAAVLYVPERNQALVPSTLPTSHGYEPPADPSAPKPATPSPFSPPRNTPFVANFEFVGSLDSTAYLCVRAALAFRAAVCGGERAVTSYVTGLAREGGRRVAEALGTEVLVGEEGGAAAGGGCGMVNVRLPVSVEELHAAAAEWRKKGGREAPEGEGGEAGWDVGGRFRDWMCEEGVQRHGVFFAVLFSGGAWWVRLSAQVYLDVEDFEWSARVLRELCERGRRGEFLDGVGQEGEKTEVVGEEKGK